MAGKKNQLELKELTDKVVAKITSNFEVDEILLFGSYAKGTENDLSDVDIAVVSPELSEDQPIFRNVLTISKRTKLYEPYLQLVAFPSKVFYNEESFVNPDFIKEIKNTAKVLYRTKAKI